MEFKLTSSQKNFYTKNIALDSTLWNQSVLEVFPKVYSYEQLNDAYNRLVKANDSIRVKFKETDDGIVTYVEDFEYENYPLVKVDSEEELMVKARAFLNSTIDFYGRLINCIIFQTPTTSGVMICAHHIVVDGFSGFVMSKQINEFLQNPDFIPLTEQYSEYIEKEEQHKKSKRFLRDKEFWKNQFDTNPVCDIFSAQNSKLDFSSSELMCPFPSALYGKIKEFCENNDISTASFFNTVYATYISRKYDVENFTIGVPVLNRTTQTELNTVGLYMHIIPLVVNLQTDSFLANAQRIQDSWMNIFRHQKFTQYDIREMLKEENKPINTLFDVTADVLEFEPNDDYKIILPYSENLSIPLEFHLQCFNNEERNLVICYRTSIFNEQEIQSMQTSIIALIEDAVENPHKNTSALEIVSPGEKQKLLYDFNNTTAEYARDKCIHELFEEQVERTPDKVALVATDKNLTYRELNEEANRIAHSLMEKGIEKGDIVGLMLPRKSCLLTALFGILKTGAAYLPIDMELPEERIEQMCKDTNARLVVSEDNIESLLQTENTSNPCVEMTNESLCYCIYTSGSTGQPKGVMARHRNVVNYISKNEHNIFGKIIKEDFEAILSISTCSFDIFVTETVATLVNGLRVVLANEQECRNQYALNRLLTREKGEFLQTTPTKLKVLTAEPSQREFLKNVKAILLGGEAMEKSYLNELKKITNAKIYNIYGVTEVPIWSTFADTDTFVDEVTVGKPIANTQVYILDKHLNSTPIGVAGELCIAGDSVSSGYLNRPEQTEEKFIDNPFGKGKLYRTGDHAYWREDGNLVYVGRKDFQVKIRGLRIELGEIESVLQAVEGIDRAVVVVRKDKEDRQLLCAFYTGTNFDAKELRTALSATLPKYMVPHTFTYLEKMPMTASGKANRNALPEIDLENIGTDTEYVAPGTAEEKALTEAIEEVLKTEKVSVLENFFDMGGDSLKSIELTSKLEAKGYTVNIKSIFEAVNIQELAKALTSKEEKEETIEYDSVLPATSAQMNVYTAQMIDGRATLYNISYIFKTEELNPEQLEKAINQFVSRHESLRTHFENRNGEIVQVIDEKATAIVERLENDNPTEFIKPFDLSKSPLLRVGYYENTVMIDMHHIIADGSSSAIFFKELNELYMGRELSETIQYGEFAVTDSYTEEDEQYWLSVFNEEPTTLDLITDYSKTETRSFKGTNIYTRIDKDLNEKIQGKCKKLKITPYAYYMACYNIFLSKYSGNEDICVGTPTSGRRSKFLNTIGMFVNMLSLRNQPDGRKTFVDFVNEVKDNSIEAISHQKYPQQELIKKTNSKKTLYDAMFAYQSEEMTEITFGDKKTEVIPTPVNTAKCDLSFYVFPRENETVLMVEYCTDLYKEETIDKFIKAYTNILTQALNENILIKDIDVLTETERNTILKDFNNTSHTYEIPENTTIYSLFEKASEENKDKVCLKANDEELTFKDFKAYAERIDGKVREYTNNEKSVIAVICERSFEMYGAVYGIIRGGNAYLPIDPNYPQDRIDYILANSNAKAVIAQEKFCYLAGNVPCINATEVLKETEQPTKTEILATPEDTAYVIYTSGSTGNPKGARISHKSAVNRILWMHDFYPLEENDVILQKTPYTFDVSVWELFWWGMTGGTLCASKPDEHFLPAKILEETEKNKVTHLHFVPSVFDIFLTYLENNPEEQYKFNTVKYVFLSGEALTANHIKRFYSIYDYNKVQLHNLYGPTECAVDVSYYACKPADEEPVPIGKPIYNTQLYVVDKNLNPTPIGVVGELCIGGVNVGQGYLNNEQLTNEKFIDNPFHEGKIYKTGDLAFWREDGQICYVGRNDFQVKIHGQRIELGEIENAILSMDGVVQCAVIVRKDNEGRQHICAFYTGEETEAKEFRTDLSTKLPKYMVPHVFMHIEEMPMTSSGKTNRKALPEIDFTKISSETEYVAPETEEEKALAEVVCSVLRIDSVNMLDNFFNIGGDSISSIYVVSELEEMGYELHVSDIMQSDTLSDVAKAMKSTSNKAMYEQNEVNGFIPFTPIMRAYINENKEIKKDFVHTCIISADCNEDTAKKALDTIISHHDMLRGTFTDNGIEAYPSDEREVYSFEVITIEDTEKAKECLNNNISIDDEKLVKVVFCKTEKENLISITVHHFLIDLISWEVLMEDFITVVKQMKNNEEISLPAKTASFKMWSEEQEKYSEIISEENKAYWKNINETLDNTRPLNSQNGNKNEAEKFSFTFSKDFSDKFINEANRAYGTRTNELLLTALGIAAGKFTESSVGIIVESHGRTELHKPIAIERTIGWFTSCYPVVINNNNSVTDEIINTKETLRRIPKNGIEYLLLSQGFHKNTDIIFNFYRNNFEDNKRNKELVGFNSATSLIPNKVSVDCSVIDNILSVNVAVPNGNHRLNISEELGMEFVRQIENIAHICTTTDTVTKTRSDFSDDELTVSELDELKDLFDWIDDDE